MAESFELGDRVVTRHTRRHEVTPGHPLSSCLTASKTPRCRTWFTLPASQIICRDINNRRNFMGMFNCPTCGSPKHQTSVYCGGTTCTVGPRETVESLRGALATDPRWLRVCNFIVCGNLLRADEHLVCEDHPKSKMFTLASGRITVGDCVEIVRDHRGFGVVGKRGAIIEGKHGINLWLVRLPDSTHVWCFEEELRKLDPIEALGELA